MDSVDLEVLKRCADWLSAGRRVLLVTVVALAIAAAVGIYRRQQVPSDPAASSHMP